MAWELSHAPEALAGARDRLYKKPIGWLLVCLAENKAQIFGEVDEDGDPVADYFCLETYELEYEKLKQTDKENKAEGVGPQSRKDNLAEAIWKYAEEDIRTTDNGGRNMHMCFSGCHSIAFPKQDMLDK